MTETDHPPVQSHRLLVTDGDLYELSHLVVRECPDHPTGWNIVSWGETKEDALRGAGGASQ